MNNQILKIKVMLEMQNDLNKVVDADWKNKNFNWDLAIVDESMELMNHYGWKWWKHQEPNLDQCKLELVDIWHFILSKSLLNEEDQTEQLLHSVMSGYESSLAQKNQNSIRNRILDLVNIASSTVVAKKNYDVTAYRFGILCRCFDLTIEEIFRLYVMKNALNIFRQENGYKTGTYRKIWNDGREDNEHLMDICLKIDMNDPNCGLEIKNKLKEQYLNG